MKIFVLGATGRSGLEFVKLALGQGNEVTAFGRNPKNMGMDSPNLTVIEGNIFNKEAVSAALKGSDAVVSCLGFSRKPQPVNGFVDSTRTIVESMRENEIKRIIVVSSWYTDVNAANSRAGFFIRWVLIPFIKPMLLGMKEMEDYIEKECQDIDYTVVRAPKLGTGVKTDKPLYAYEDNMIDTGLTMNRVNRSDLAMFMWLCLKNNQYVKKMIAIAHNERK